MKTLTSFIRFDCKAIKHIALLIFLLSASLLSKAQLKADFNSINNKGCAPLVVKFNDASAGDPASWLWDLGNGTTSVLQNPSAAYFEPGTYSVKLIARKNGEVDSVIKVQYVTVYASPVVNFSSSDVTGCFPLNTQFTDLSFPGSGSVEKWEWDFGDGNFASTQNPAHEYTALGDFNVSLRVTNNFGCVTTKTVPSYIHINSGVKAAFTNSITKSCNAPSTVSFQNGSSGTGVLTYDWDFGDGKTSALENPSHTYQSSGSYTVSLIVTNSTGCTDTLVKSKLITIGSTKADFSIADSVCEDAQVNFKNTSNPAAVTSFWYFGDGTFSNLVNPTKAYTNAGVYTVKMIANFGSCMDSVTKTVKVIGKPTANFTATSTVSCKAPLMVNFENGSTGGTTYSWDFGDRATSTVENPSHTYLAEGSYKVKLLVTNEAGCQTSIEKNDFIKIKKPVVTLDRLPQKGCAPLTHRFSASVNSVDAISNYQWNFGDGSFSNDVSPTHVYNTPGRYTVTLTYTTAGGCIDSVKSINGILVGSKPQANFIVNPVNACADKDINFTDQSLGSPDEWLWSFGDGSSSGAQNPVHQYNDTGYFNITLIATNNGCSDTIIVPRKVHINPPVAAFAYSKTCEKPGVVSFTDHSIGADYRTWTFGDGSTSTDVNPVHEYISSGIYKVSLTVTNQSTGCSKTKTEEVRVVREVADFISNTSVTCKNSPVNFTASNSAAANINLYTWKFGDGTYISNASRSVSHQYSKASGYDVTLIIRDVFGCTDTITKALAVKVNGPTAVFRSSVPGICLNNEVNFIDSSYSDGEHPIQQWESIWGDGTSQTFTAPPFNHTYASPGTYTVTLKVIDSNGCTDVLSKSKTIIVSRPVAAFTADTLSCTTTLVNFHNTSSGPSLIYTWDLGDGAVSDKQNPSHLYTTEGYYSVSLSITDQFGCSSSVSKTNYIKIANPVADFTMSDSVSTCPPLVVNFTDNSANYSKWQWDFGDGNTSMERNPSHFYSSVGTFNVVLTVFGAGGCSSQQVKHIRVDGPTGSISYTNLMGCKPLQTDFTVHSKNNVSFVWDFNDGTTIPTKDSITSHTFTSQGKYLPKIILEDSTGCKVPVKGKDSITVFGVKASFDHNGALVCDTNKVEFVSKSVSNDLIANYFWNFGDGSSSVQPQPQHSYSHAGLYHTSLKVVTQRGCVDSMDNPNPVKVNNSPQIKITGIAGACVPAEIKFSGILSNPDTSTVSWKWDFANGNVSAQQNPAAQTYVSAGAFKINLVASSSNGCVSTTSKAVNIYPLPDLKVSDDNIVCSGSSTTLQVSGAQTYQWSPSTYLSCNNCATPVSKPASAITYHVKGVSDKGCVSFDSVSLGVKFPFKINFSKKDTLCFGNSVQLHADGAEQYSWTPQTGLNNPLIASPKASPSSSTVYQVIGADSVGCFKDTGYIPIKVYPMPVVNAGDDKTINVGRQIEIVPQISDDVTSVVWTPSIGVVANNYPGITVKPVQSLDYNVEVKNDGGCTARDKVSVYVLCNNANIFVPNTFSPNGDGNNDMFYPRGSGVFKITNFKVFSRWGEVVFQKSYFNANDASVGWDGTYKGRKLPADVFVYVLEVVCDNNSSLVFKGNIALIR